MTAVPDVVLVSSSDEKLRRLITDGLRDHFPVRTATDAETTTTSLDTDIAVVVIDAATVDLSVDSLDTDEKRTFYQLLWLTDDTETGAEQADAVRDRDAPSEAVRTTVERLQLRARYDRLLTTFYERAAGEDGTGDASDPERSREHALRAIKRELDRVAAQLDDSDAFDVALDE
ncbi:MAG: hypothetical protein ACOCPX_02200 [Halapricum sp.]